MNFDRIHHLTFVVRNLQESVRRYQGDLGIGSIETQPLPTRGVLTARFRVGATWIVLVQPIDAGEPMTRLLEHGEGLFLVSYEVKDLYAALAELESRGAARAGPVREGLEGWLVVDIATNANPGALTQLCQVKSVGASSTQAR